MSIVFKDDGSVDIKSLTKNITYNQVQAEIAEKMKTLQVTIDAYQKSLVSLTAQLDRLQHEYHFLWPLFDKDGKRKIVDNVDDSR